MNSNVFNRIVDGKTVNWKGEGKRVWTPFQQYAIMLYHATSVFNLVDIGPRLEIELATLSCILLVSAMVNAYIYGQISLLAEILQQKESEK